VGWVLYHTHTESYTHLFFLTLIQVLYIDTTYIFTSNPYKRLRHSFWPYNQLTSLKNVTLQYPFIFKSFSLFQPIQLFRLSQLISESAYLNHLTNLNQPRLFGQPLEGMDLQQPLLDPNSPDTELFEPFEPSEPTDHLDQPSHPSLLSLQSFFCLELISFTFCRSKFLAYFLEGFLLLFP